MIIVIHRSSTISAAKFQLEVDKLCVKWNVDAALVREFVRLNMSYGFDLENSLWMCENYLRRQLFERE